MAEPKIYKMSFAKVYPLLVKKVEKKGRTEAELKELIFWLTGYNESQLETLLDEEVDYETFINKAPQLNPHREYVTGVICGTRVEDMEPSTMKEIRYLDKMVDELAKGKSMSKIFREDKN